MPHTPLLEVAIAHEHDVAGAQEGGADRLVLAAGTADDPRSPDLEAASAVLRAAEVPVRVVLRLNEGHTTTGGEFTRLVGLAEEYVALGAEGLVWGFLDPDLRVDAGLCRAVAEALPGVPWTFPRSFDLALDPVRAWREVRGLPGLTAVCSAGSSRGLEAGAEDLFELARRDLGVAELLMPGGGLVAEQVPWFARLGVWQYHLDEQARPGGSAKAWVDAAHVRSWRLLVDDAATRAQ